MLAAGTSQGLILAAVSSSAWGWGSKKKGWAGFKGRWVVCLLVLVWRGCVTQGESTRRPRARLPPSLTGLTL